MAILTVLGMLLLMPVYATGENDMSDLPRLGLSNVEQESSRLWAPAIMIWVFSGIILYVIKKNYTELLAMRKETMKKGEPNHYTVLITKIPEEFDSEEKVREFMEPMYSEQIAHVKLVRNLKERERKTTELVKQKLKLVVAMKKAEDAKEKGEDPPMVKTGCCGLCGESVEAVPHYTQKVKEIREEIETKLRVEDAEYCKAAFVTFKTVSSAVKASRVKLTDEESWEIRAATRPTDITWPNLCSVKMKAVEDTAVMTSNAAKWGLIVFWAIPIAAGGALSNLEQLGQDYSFLEGVTSLPPALIAIIEGFGPTIWRVVLMILLQPIIYALINMTGVIEISAKENKFMSTYYFFLLTNIYFVTLLASSIFSTINDIVNDPVSIFELLGESIPAVAIEMIQYMLLQGLGLGVEPIVRLVPLILNILFNKLAVVDYQREQLNKPPPFLYGAGLSMACLIWTISLAYMTIAPLILPFATLYFFINYLVQKYQLTWVHCPDFETYGTFWPQLMSIAMGGLLLSQVATMAIIGLKFGSFQQILIFPVIFITAMCMYQMQSTMGEEMSDSSLPLLNATHLDKERNLASVGKFLDVCHARPMWAQPCVLVTIFNTNTRGL